tara:strand:- start:1190 stop:1426 length:237 start_codon:yes stop_codon:yes gene_type:complete
MHALGPSLKSDPFVQCDRERYASTPLFIDACDIDESMQAYDSPGPVNPDTLFGNRMDYTKDLSTRPSLATDRRPVGIN